MSLIPILRSIAVCLKLLYISKLVNLNCTFNAPFKISHYNGNFTPILRRRIFEDSPYSHINVFQVYYILYEDEYDKINELSKF